MMNRFEKRTRNQRWLLGMGLPFVGSLLLWMLWRNAMSWMIDLSGYRGLNLTWITPRDGLLIFAIMLLAGVGAAFVGSLRALLVVPLALLIGCLVGLTFFAVGPLSSFYHYDPIKYLIPILGEAFIGAALGLVVARWGVPVGQRTLAALQQQVKAEAELHVAPTQIFPSASAPKTRGGRQETIPVSPPVSAQEQPVPQQSAAIPAPEQDDIARVVAEMQRAYAEAKPHEPNNGTHQTL